MTTQASIANHELHLSIDKAFGNLYRKRCVLVAVETQSGNILLGAKPAFYPPTIVRLLGGGVDEYEPIEKAVARELREEIGITVPESDFILLATIDTHATDKEGNEYHNQTFVYHTKINDQKYQPGDDVKYVVELSRTKLYELGEQYDSLSKTLWYKGVEGEFSWADYGKMYGPIHKLTANSLKLI